MKELIKKAESIKNLKENFLTAATVIHIFVFFSSLLLTRSSVYRELFPLGVVFAAAVPTDFMPSAAIGAFIGYFFKFISNGNFRYIAALVAVVAVRLLVFGYKKLASSMWFTALLTALSLGFSAPVLIKSTTAFSLAGEILISVLLSVCFKKSFFAAEKRRAGLYPAELGCLLVSLAFLLSGGFSFTVFGISVSGVLAALLVLCGSKYGGISVGAFCGIAVSFAALMSGRAGADYSIYAFLGIVSGVFSAYGKIASALSVIAAALIGIANTPFFGGSLQFISEITVGCVIFAVLPKAVGNGIGAILSCRPEISLQSDVKKLLKIKLGDASRALLDVSETVEKVSSTLSGINSPDIASLYKSLEENACKGCKLRIHCWEHKRELTVNAASTVISGIKSVGQTPAVLPEEFRCRCLRTEKFEEETLKLYNDFSGKIAAENRIAEVRSVVSEQFSGISDMLLSLSNEMEECETFDKPAAISAAAALKTIGIYPTESVCKVDKYGRITLKIKAKSDKDTVLNKMQMMKTLSVALGRKFDIPQITGEGGALFITMGEKPVYKVDIGVHGITAAGSSMCGDSYKYFYDGHGRFIIVLSDGMGTGGAAAVDSAMACDLMSRLIKSGFNFDCALKILNSSMIFKSTGESMATLDIATVDLFSGLVKIYKSGAAPSVVKRGGRVGVAEGISLPVGILRDVSFDRAQIKLKQKDILVMMSDGASFEGTDWIKRELENCGENSAANLSEMLALAARRRRSDKHEDDITVISVVLEKAI